MEPPLVCAAKAFCNVEVAFGTLGWMGPLDVKGGFLLNLRLIYLRGD